jgi:cytochrome c oxidase cbb3-type subunit 2
MSLRTFILGLTASFGIAWLLVLVVPFVSMKSVPPVPFDEEADGRGGVYHPKRAGRTVNGALVYAANGCNQCHSQLVRPTFAGSEMFRDDWGGLAGDPDRGDTRRETNLFDFTGEEFAFIGQARLGPDLSNLGRRLEARLADGGGPTPEQWLYRHLLDPRADPANARSLCPSFRFLFKEVPRHGAELDGAMPVPGEPDRQLVATAEARALVSYLLNLRRDDETPASMTPPIEGQQDQPGT